MKAKKKWMFLGLTVLVVVAAGLGYWKRIGIRNTLYRMLDKQIPLTGDVYGYYGQEVKVKENLNEETSFQMEDSYADKIDTTITKESSMVDTSWQIDQQIEALRDYYHEFENANANTKVKADSYADLKIAATDENGEELLEGVEDDDIADAVFNIVMERAEAEDEE